MMNSANKMNECFSILQVDLAGKLIKSSQQNPSCSNNYTQRKRYFVSHISPGINNDTMKGRDEEMAILQNMLPTRDSELVSVLGKIFTNKFRKHIDKSCTKIPATGNYPSITANYPFEMQLAQST
jgi:hypothetical protein